VDEENSALQHVISERDKLKQHCEHLEALLGNISYPPGHFYSPIVDVCESHAIEAVRNRVSAPLPAGIALDAEKLKSTMNRLAEQHRHFRFPRHPQASYRFYFDNPFFGCHDASILFSMLLEFRPRRIIEIGCGHSSRLLLDTNAQFFAGTMELTFIDPSLDSLTDLGSGRESLNPRLISSPVQDVGLTMFEQLEENDIVFLDSSHVSKTGSDVNYFVFEILPVLKPGVLVHIHDIFYAFEYLENWVLKEKRSWNEAYLIRAFLQYNAAFEIVYWNNFVWHRLRDELAAAMPLCLENEGGSIWLKRTS
jgi:hypothetical protein